MSKNPKDRFQTATETLLYFQKMRADDQLKISQGLNITEEVGLKISSVDTPRAEEAKNQPKQRSNRFNMSVESTASRTSVTKPSIPIVSLGDRMPKPTPVPSPVGQTLGSEATLTQKFIEERKKQIFGANAQNAIDPTAALRAKRINFLSKAFL